MCFEHWSGAPVEVVGTLAAIGYPARNSDRLEILGTSGSILFSDFELQLNGKSRRREIYGRDSGYQESFDRVIEHFVDCIENERPFETGPADNLKTLALVEDAYALAGR
jgi:predicted dehydrogenase